MRAECNGAGERRRSDGDPWGAIERSRSESRRAVTRRVDRELKPSDCPAVHGPPAAVRGSKGARPFGAQGSGDGARHPRETPRGARRRRRARAGGGPMLFRPGRVYRPARLAVDSLGVPEADPDGSPSAGARQRVGLGRRGGDEAPELIRARRRGPHLERAAVAARLVLDVSANLKLTTFANASRRMR